MSAMDEVRSERKNDGFCIFLSGRISSSNASEVEEEIARQRSGEPGGDLTLDAEKLEYISSAGLRVILRLRRSEPGLRMINVSSDVYEILEMTGFTEIIPVDKAYRVLSVDGCAVIGRGAKGTVYRLNPDTIIKVYKDPDSLPAIQRERELARKAFVLGVPTAISFDVVRVGETFGSVFELLDAKTLSDLICEKPEEVRRYAEIFADLLKLIHKTEVEPEDMPDVKELIRTWIRDLDGTLPAEQKEKISGMVEEVPDVLTMIHGDYHTNNVMMMNGEPILIDMDTLSHGNPVFELANVYTSFRGFGEIDRQMQENFLGMSVELAGEVWDCFIARYLGTQDKEKIGRAEDRIRLLSYTRTLRHYVRRKDTSPAGTRAVSYCSGQITELLKRVDDLML